MNPIDLLIIVAIIGFAVRGARTGLVRQISSFGSFLLGLYLGAVAAPHAVEAVRPVDPGIRAFIIIMTILGVATVISGIGEYLGAKLLSLSDRFKLQKVDRSLGAGFSVILVLTAVWLLGSLLKAVPDGTVAIEAQRSKILAEVDRRLPPAPPVIARLQHIIDESGFPDVFIGTEPPPSAPVGAPTSEEVAAAIRTAGPSTVKIEGVGCGGVVDGSGFVAGNGLVVTNAHVVAGLDRPFVLDRNGRHAARTVLFDPNLDIAVLRTTGLAGAPLPISTVETPRGTRGAVLGYPGGGGFVAGPAAILGSMRATGRNIYNQGVVTRRIYEVQADVKPGNSGGPVVTPDGTVIGVVFARARGQEGTAYAITGAEASARVSQAATSGPVSTGACAAE